MRVLPPLPATAQTTQPTSAIPPVGRVVAAQVVTPVAGELYQVRAGDVMLQIRSTVPLLQGQQVRLQLQARQDGPAQWVLLSADGQEGGPPAMPVRQGALPTTASPLPSAAAAQAGTAAPSASAGNLSGTVTATLGQGQYQVRAGEQLLRAYSQEPLFKGQALLLQPPAKPGMQWLASPESITPIRRQLQASLPRQQDPTLLMAVLQKLAPRLPASGGSPMQQAAAALLAGIPEAAALHSPEALKQALHQSGLLQDSAPGQAPNLRQILQLLLAATPADMPAAARRQAAASMPPGQVQAMARQAAASLEGLDADQLMQQLAGETRAVLARLETHQLMHLQQQDGPVRQWLFELPVRSQDGIDVWQLHVKKDDRQPAGDELPPDRTPLWNITLSVDFPETGAMIIRLGLHGDQLHAHFHAAATATHERIRELLPALADLLVAKGLPAPLLSSQAGLPHPDVLPPAMQAVLRGVTA